MRVIQHERATVVEFESQADLVAHITRLMTMLQEKTNFPHGFSMKLADAVTVRNGDSVDGTLTYRTEY